MMRNATLSLIVLVAAGCNYSGDFLFPGAIEGVPDIYVLTAEDGDVIVPADITSSDDVRAATIYAEVGPAQTTGYGGVTLDFVGTGGDICVWVDPELTTWNTAVSLRPDDIARKWSYPDNIFDDGDLDLFAGLSVYYTGSPGETIGDFVVSYEDSLGNEIPISLAACPNLLTSQESDATAGRGSPEYCTIPATELDIDYTILLRTWSTPLDDDRLAYGVIVANGGCDALRATMNATLPEHDECVILGEALVPDEGGGIGPFYGFDAIDGKSWPNSIDFEQQFCIPSTGNDPKERMKVFCDEELARLEADGRECEWEEITDPANRCFCGDPDNLPEGGAN